MMDFWIACGHHLLDRDESGGLCVTDDFLKAYFARPELMPPDDACPVERRLHRELLPAYTGLFRNQGVIMTKAALGLLGLPGGPVRMPLSDATAAETEQLRTDLAAAGIKLK